MISLQNVYGCSSGTKRIVMNYITLLWSQRDTEFLQNVIFTMKTVKMPAVLNNHPFFDLFSSPLNFVGENTIIFGGSQH